MKIVVASDVHGELNRIFDIVQQNIDMDAMVFLGDGIKEIEDIQNAYPKLRIYSVSGNCDRYSFFPQESLAGFGGMLIFYTHGHSYNVKAGMENIKKRGKAAGADIVLFGHTHSPYYEEYDNMYIFNPGSVADSRVGKATYGVINITNQTAKFKHIEIL